MVATDSLFRLIKSLSKSEKGYIKKFASLHAGDRTPNYLKLFDAIDKQSVYRESLLKESLKGELFVTRLAFEKIYLTDLIYKALALYYAGKNIRMVLIDILERVEIAFEKLLINEAWKLLAKAQGIAGKYQKFPEMLLIIQWQKQMLHFMMDKKNNLERINQLEGETIKNYALTAGFQKISHSFFNVYYEIGQIRNSSDTQRIKKIISDPLLKNEPVASTFIAKCHFINIWANYYSMTWKYDKSCMMLKKLVEYMEMNPALLSDNIPSYVRAIRNLMMSLVFLGEFQEVLNCTERLKIYINKMARISLHNTLFAEQTFLNYSLAGRIYKGDFHEALSLVPSIVKYLKTHAGILDASTECTFNINIACAYFGNANYREAMKWLSKILNLQSSLVRQDLYSAAKVMQLITNYEMKNFDLIPYLSRSCYRYLRSRERPLRVEKIVLEFISKPALDINSKTDMLKAFTLARNQIKKAFEDPFEKEFQINFDLLSWLESKIENRPFSKIVKEKSK